MDGEGEESERILNLITISEESFSSKIAQCQLVP